MLTKEDNELICRTGPGTPMGELFRRFWLPAVQTEEIPETDSEPLRIRMLSEDLIAFRDTSGKVGIVDVNCAHRGASLFFGRNEEHGLRCVYHGWKYDVDGNCIDMPNEPEESNFKNKIHLKAYPTVERSGVIWVYMGPPDKMGAPPDLEWARVTEDHVVVTKYISECNYLQAMEGNMDSSHISFLHGGRPPALENQGAQNARGNTSYSRQDRAPRYTVVKKDYGLMLGARRNAGDDGYYWRISQFMLPVFDMIGHDPGVAMSGHAAVPVDDEHVMLWAVRWEGDRPMTPEEREMWGGENARVPVIPGSHRPQANKNNDYMIDRELQRTSSYTGIPPIGPQDLAVTESMGPIYKRWQEHLGTTDLAIIRARQELLKAVRDLQNGVEPYAASHPDVYHIRPFGVVLPRNVAFDQDPRVLEATTARA
jgi:phthalate 4,5-dioxygenase